MYMPDCQDQICCQQLLTCQLKPSILKRGIIWPLYESKRPTITINLDIKTGCKELKFHLHYDAPCACHHDGSCQTGWILKE